MYVSKLFTPKKCFIYDESYELSDIFLCLHVEATYFGLNYVFLTKFGIVKLDTRLVSTLLQYVSR